MCHVGDALPWLVMRANLIENRNVFALGSRLGVGGVMRVVPRSQSSMCIRTDSLILAQTQGGINESPNLSVANTFAHGEYL